MDLFQQLRKMMVPATLIHRNFQVHFILEIGIKPDPDAGAITISDTGVWMAKDELKDYLGTIAQSGNSKILKPLKVQRCFFLFHSGYIYVYAIWYYLCDYFFVSLLMANELPFRRTKTLGPTMV